MALGGASIVWAEGVPSSTSNAGLGEQDLRSIKTSVRNALDSEHVFPSTGGTAGAHRPGSAVAFYAASSAISSTDTDGRIFIASDTSQVFHVGSAITMLLGGRYAVLSGPAIKGDSTYTSTTTQYFCVEGGSGSLVTTSATTTITLQHTYVGGVATAQGIDQGLSSGVRWAAVAGGTFTGNTITVRSYASDGQQSAPQTAFKFNYTVIGVVAL